jgi:low affinity Fe/Cu permease
MIQRSQNKQATRQKPLQISRRYEANGTKPANSLLQSDKKSASAAEKFHHFAHKGSEVLGSVWAFFIAGGIIVVWLASGFLFGFSDTWQLVINTATTIVTFLMVFLIQNTQNRDARAIQLKLDELLRGVKGARNRLIALEEYSDEELEELQKEFERVRKKTPVGKKASKPE